MTPRNPTLSSIIIDQLVWSAKTFGAGRRTTSLTNHIRKELLEIEAAPDDLEEWIDVMILAMDGAWRTGATATEIVDALLAKMQKNRSRTWPDPSTLADGEPSEHVRDS